MWILLHDWINPDFLFLLKFPTTTNNNEALFQLPHVPRWKQKCSSTHHSKYYSVLQVGTGCCRFLAGGLRLWVWLRGFVFLYLLSWKRKCRRIRDLLPEEAIVSHLITCAGRDHIVKIQSGRQSLVIVNVHFELELTFETIT